MIDVNKEVDQLVKGTKFPVGATEFNNNLMLILGSETRVRQAVKRLVQDGMIRSQGNTNSMVYLLCDEPCLSVSKVADIMFRYMGNWSKDDKRRLQAKVVEMSQGESKKSHRENINHLLVSSNFPIPSVKFKQQIMDATGCGYRVAQDVCKELKITGLITIEGNTRNAVYHLS